MTLYHDPQFQIGENYLHSDTIFILMNALAVKTLSEATGCGCLLELFCNDYI